MRSMPDRAARRARFTGNALVGAIVLIVAGVISLFAWIAFGFFRDMPQFRAEVAAAQRDGAEIMNSLETRPGAVLAGSRTMEQSERLTHAHGGIVFHEVLDAPGDFAETADWYIEKLRANGWVVTDRDARSVTTKRGQWRLRIIDAPVADLPPPSCRYRLWLGWSHTG
jgi:hypothetical protein